MDTRKVATEYRLTQWSQIVQTRLSRGQSIKDFCESEGISKNTYFYWQRKLREAACKMAQQAKTPERGLAPAGWTQLMPPEMPESSLAIEIGGCRIAVSRDTDPELLVKICRALKAL